MCMVHVCVCEQGDAVLPPKELWWLGNDAHRLAKVLDRDNSYIHACPVMQLACEALVTWSYQDNDNTLVLQRAKEVNLMFIYSTIYDITGNL